MADQREQKRVEAAVDRHGDDIVAKANVVSVGAAGDHVVAFVSEKLPLDELDPADVVPPDVDGIPTDVIQVGRVEAKGLAPGASIGHFRAGSGTLGCAVMDRDGQVFALTNWHVAAGPPGQAQPLDWVHHPGGADAAPTTTNRWGRTWMYRPILMGGAMNHDDAALVLVQREQVDRCIGAFGPPLAPQVGWTLTKTGRTTGTTSGKVLATNATAEVGYGSTWARFRGQVITDFMLDSGDSGSVGKTSGGRASVLGFAGSDTISIHTPLTPVLAALGVSLL